MSGVCVKSKLEMPRTRSLAPVPTSPEPSITSTLGARPLSRSWKLWTGAICWMREASMVVTELPISRLVDAPAVAVTTTSSRLVARGSSANCTVVSPTVTLLVSDA